MENSRTINKGDFVFKAGDKAQTIYTIQTGSVSVFIPRNKGNIELYHAGPLQILGEYALSGVTTHYASAVAVTDTKVFEVPVDVMKNEIECHPQLIKVLIRGLGDRLKHAMQELKSFKVEKDSSACPPEQVPKVFGTFYHAGMHLGKTTEGKTTIEWRPFKNYCQRVFHETPKRIEQALNILVKLKFATIEMIKNPEDPKKPDELGYVHLTNFKMVEQFFEYYQFYFYKSGKMDLLKVDESCLKLVELLLKQAETAKVDRLGVVRLEYGQTLDLAKRELGMALHNTHFERLEQKGLFVKRATLDGGGVELSFDLAEFQRTFWSWKIIKEIDKWNEKGFVDVNEVEVKKPVAVAGKTCASCAGEITDAMKFCANCGMKLAA